MVKKILIINPFGIGDVLFTTPLIHNLTLAYPNAFIGYISNKRAQDAIKNNPKVKQIYIYERDEFNKDLIGSWLTLYQEIKKERFDMVFDFSLNPSFVWFCMLCGIKKRIGYNYRQRGRFLTQKLVLKGYEGKHVISYYLDLLKCLKISNSHQNMEIYPSKEDQNWGIHWFRENNIDLKKPIIAVIPGGGASWGKEAKQKQWPVEQYVLLVDKLIAKTGANIILMGDSKDKDIAQILFKHCSFPLVDAVGQTSLLQMAALLQKCQLAIVNDGGPLHIAVASKVKTVSIFGPVDPAVYGPYPKEGHLIIQKHLVCQPCYRNFRKSSCDHLSCLKELTAQEVFSQIERYL